MLVGMMTREYPPDVYGGAGVHVTELTRFMRRIDNVEVDVHCMGQKRDEEHVYAYGPDPQLGKANSAITTLSTGLRIAAAAQNLDIAHSHTWYSGLAGHLTALLNDIPHVVTAHSLEPDRPWKREQLHGGYEVSSWSEKNAMEHADAIIAVSAGMKEAIVRAYPQIDDSAIHVVHNGVDTSSFYPGQATIANELGVDTSKPIVAFVGRITRQKGVAHLLKAAAYFDPEVQLILCAGAPDTSDIATQTHKLVQELSAQRDGVFWVQDMLPTAKIREVYATADVFVCPSIYEPLGIVNLEAMACGTAVVASRVGGIPEVVVDGDTGILVDYDQADPETFQRAIAEAVNTITADREHARRMGEAGLERVRRNFTWDEIAEETVDIYKSLM